MSDGRDTPAYWDERAGPHLGTGEDWRGVSVGGSHGIAEEMQALEERGVRRLAELLPRPGRILDAGCGYGRWFPVTGAGRAVTGIDFSPVLVERGQENERGFPVILGDVRDLPIENDSFDAAYTVKSLQCLRQHERAGAVAELFRAVRPGGRVLVFEKTRHEDGSDPVEWITWAQQAGGRLVRWYPNYYGLLVRLLHLAVTGPRQLVGPHLAAVRRGRAADNGGSVPADRLQSHPEALKRAYYAAVGGVLTLSAPAEPLLERLAPRPWAHHGIFVFDKVTRRKVLIVTPDFPPTRGGIGTHTHEMAKHWSPAEDVTVVVSDDGKERPSRAAPGFRIESARAVKVPAGRLLGTVRTVTRVLRESPIDLVYSSHWRAVGVAVRLSLMLSPGRPAMAQAIHGSEVLYLREEGIDRAALRHLFGWVVSRARVLVALGSYQKVLLESLGVEARKVFVSPEGVDLDRFENVEPEVLARVRDRHELEGKTVLVTVGRLVERKGQDVVIRAMPEILRAVPDARYLIVGTGPYEDTLRTLIRSAGVNGSVSLCGQASEPELLAYYAACDVFVMPARELKGDTEGFGIVYLEAGALGKPSIGGRSGGVGDAIVHAETGLLVDPESPSEVAAAAVRLLCDRETAARMGRAAERRVREEFRYETVARDILYAVTGALTGSTSPGEDRPAALGETS